MRWQQDLRKRGNIMALVSATHRRDRLTAAELASFESLLRQDGYRLVTKASESELLPGEYLKRQQSTFVYAYASPVVWEVVWSDLAGQRVPAHGKAEIRNSRH